MHIEAPYVNDHLKVASNADRIDELADATTVVGDIKTAANPIKARHRSTSFAAAASASP